MFLTFPREGEFLARPWGAGLCGVRAAEPHPPFSFRGKKTGGVTVQKKGVCIGGLRIEELHALRNVSAVYMASP